MNRLQETYLVINEAKRGVDLNNIHEIGYSVPSDHLHPEPYIDPAVDALYQIKRIRSEAGLEPHGYDDPAKHGGTAIYFANLDDAKGR